MSSKFENLEKRLVPTDNASIFWSDLSLAVQILLPLALAALLLSKKFSVLPLRGYVSVWWPSANQKQNVLSWLNERIPYASGLTKNISQYWKDGSLLCTLINTAIPGACPNPQRHWKQPPVHAQALAYKYFGLEPVLASSDFAQKKLSLNSERKFINYLVSLQEVILNYAIDTEALKFTNNYIARGMGLIIGEKNKMSTFYLYPNADGEKLKNIFISIKGPYSSYGKQMITSSEMSKNARRLAKMRKEAINEKKKLTYRSNSQKSFFKPLSFDIRPILGYLSRDGKSGDISIKIEMEKDRAKVSFVPKHSGIYELLLTTGEEHIHGSPFVIRVTKPNGDERKSKKLLTAKSIDFIDESVDITNENMVFLKVDQNNNPNGENENSKNQKIEAMEIIQKRRDENYGKRGQTPIRIIIGDGAEVRRQNTSNEEKEKVGNLKDEAQRINGESVTNDGLDKNVGLDKKEEFPGKEELSKDKELSNNKELLKNKELSKIENLLKDNELSKNEKNKIETSENKLLKSEELSNNKKLLDLNEFPQNINRKDLSTNVTDENSYFDEDKEFEKIYKENISENEDTLNNFDTALSDLGEDLSGEKQFVFEAPVKESKLSSRLEDNVPQIGISTFKQVREGEENLENEENSLRREANKRRFSKEVNDRIWDNDEMIMMKENRENVIKESNISKNRWKFEENHEEVVLGKLNAEEPTIKETEIKAIITSEKEGLKENKIDSSIIEETQLCPSKFDANPSLKSTSNDISVDFTHLSESTNFDESTILTSNFSKSNLNDLSDLKTEIGETHAMKNISEPLSNLDRSSSIENTLYKLDNLPSNISLNNEERSSKIDDCSFNVEDNSFKTGDCFSKVEDSFKTEDRPENDDGDSRRNRSFKINDRSLTIEDQSFKIEDSSSRLKDDLNRESFTKVENQPSTNKDDSIKLQTQDKSNGINGEIELDFKSEKSSKVESFETINQFSNNKDYSSRIDELILDEDPESKNSKFIFTHIKNDEEDEEDNFIVTDEELSSVYNDTLSEILSGISEDIPIEPKRKLSSAVEKIAPLNISVKAEEKNQKTELESEDDCSLKNYNDSGFISCTTDEDSPFPTSRSIKNMVELFENNKTNQENLNVKKTSPILVDIAPEVSRLEPEHPEDSVSPSEENQISHREPIEENDISGVNVFEIKLKFERKIQDSNNISKRSQYSSANRNLLKKSMLAFTQSMPNLATNKDEYEKESFLSSSDSTNEFVMQFKEKKQFWDKLVSESGSTSSLGSNYSDVETKWKVNEHKNSVKTARSLSCMERSCENFKNAMSFEKEERVVDSNGVFDKIRVFEKDFDSEKRSSVLKRTKERSLRSFPSFQSVKSSEGIQDIHDLMHDEPVEEDLRFAEESRRRFESARHFFRSIEQINLIGRSNRGDFKSKSRSFEHKSPQRSVSLKMLNVQEKFSLDNVYRDVILNKIRNGSLKGSPNRDGVVGTLTSISSTESGLEKDFGEEDDIEMKYFRMGKKSKRRKSVKSLFEINY